MNIDELQSELDDLFPDGFKMTFDREGHLVIKTNLVKDEDGDLVSDEEEFDEDDALEALSTKDLDWDEDIDDSSEDED